MIGELNKRQIGYLIVTKSAMAADDRYIGIYDPELAHIQITVTATDDATALKYEKASAVTDRIRAIEKLQAHGLDVTVRLSPFIPEFIDFDVLNGIRCDKILVEFLRCNSFIKKTFPIDYSDYTVKQSGYWHLPLDRKRYWLSKISGFREITVCDDESEAYEFWTDIPTLYGWRGDENGPGHPRYEIIKAMFHENVYYDFDTVLRPEQYVYLYKKKQSQ